MRYSFARCTNPIAVVLAALPVAIVLLAAPVPVQAEPSHAIAMHGTAFLAADFTHLPYANPDATKGGKITLGAQGSFDSLNPMIVKGVAANGIREFVVESLMARGLDEPFTLYGLIAETVDTLSDRSSVMFTINPKAKFSDGRPVTADDVLFSFEVLREKGRPNHRTYYKKVTRAERLGDLAVKFSFDAADREMPLIMGLMPVLPKHALSAETFDQTSLEPMLGSGPYRVGRIDTGRSITYERDPNYWGRDLPINRGRYNFDTVVFEYFRDTTALFEAFKSGQIALRSEDDPGRWHEGYAIPALADARLIKAEFETGLPAGMNALVFNSRRKVFADRRVRRALALLFDFEWINKNIYNGLFKRTQSYFERSALSSQGRVADTHERALLAPFLSSLNPEILERGYQAPSTDGSGQNRDNWRLALQMLGSAGYVLNERRLIETATGQQLSFEILVSGTAQERMLSSFAADLARLGIEARVRVVDSAQYQLRLKSYDYDMIQAAWPASLSPGNEQLFRWSSSSAKTEGTFNYAGVENPAADAMIAAMLAAATREDFESAVRALDRVLLSGDYVIPLFYLPRQWVAHWSEFRHPDRTPLSGFNLDTWWRVPAAGTGAAATE